MLQMGFLKLLYGSDMRENRDKYPCDFSKNPPYEVTSTPWLTHDEILSLKNCEDALERLYNSGRFLLTLEYLITEIGVEPFDLFFKFGNAVNGNKMSLSAYVSKLFEFFKDKCDGEILREKIVCDMLCSGCEKHMPEILKIKDPLYKKVKTKLDGNFNFAILYGKNKVFTVSQNSPRDLFNRKQGEFVGMENFIDK
jgi:hypothetical protein